MVGTSVLQQTHFWVPLDEEHTKVPDFNLSFKEQECVTRLKECKNLEEFKQVHGQIQKLGLFWSSFCASNLVATCALSDWGSMDYACSIFRQVPDPGSFEFNTMIRGFIEDVDQEEAFHVYVEMLQRVVQPDHYTFPAVLKACASLGALQEGMQIHGHIFKFGFEEDVFVQNSLINMYGKCGEMRHCCRVFEQMEQRTMASWSAFFSAHANLSMWTECLELFAEMKSEGFRKADEIILVNVLSACTHLGALDLGRCTHGYLLRNFSGLNIIVQTSLVDMYVKCGLIEQALSVFRRMTEKNQVAYSVMISGLGFHGRGQEALSIFSEMLEEGLKPDAVTYVGVLTACSHAGLVEEGLRCFKRMKFEHGIEPTIQHFGCMVDLMGRAGMLNEAFELIKSMPMEPNDVLWRSLLGSCKVHCKVELGAIAAKHLLKLDSCNASDYVMLSNMYAQAQMWSDTAKTRTRLVESGVKQEPGSSLVEVKRKMFKFKSQDMLYDPPQCNGVYEMLHQMEWQLKFEGYSPDTSQVLLDVDEEEKVQRLRGHSQKLAIAFALLHTSQGTPIRIVRNVRMCSDCHAYTKLASMIYDRDITVKDRNRFHHFKSGACSCKDYW